MSPRRLAKVALYANPAKAALVDLDATNGAIVGKNLFWSDGSLVTQEQLTGGVSKTVVKGAPGTTDELPEGRFNWYGNVTTKDVAATAYTAGQADNDTILRGTADAGLTITVPAGEFTPDVTLYACQGATGAVQFVAGAGVTFLPADSAQTRDQGSVIGLKQTALDVWEPVGDLAYTFPATSVHANPTAADAQPVAMAATADKQVLKRVGTTLQWVQQKAADVTFTPTGNLASIDVQGALAELDTEKVSYVALADNASATPGAQLVGFKPSGNLTSSKVGDALRELDSKKIAKSLLTTRGDLIVADATGQPVRLPRGAVGQVLTVQADGSLAYATNAATGGTGGEMLVADGMSAPPVQLTNEAQDDYVCAG